MTNEFVEYIIEVLESVGKVTTRKMFGGYGLYKNSIIFAIISENELYFKADSKASEYFKSQGLEPFSYRSRGKIINLSYYKIPPEIIEDLELLTKYFNLAYRSGLNAKN
jgi:DNA transformation protein